jgi:hypothetical protein
MSNDSASIERNSAVEIVTVVVYLLGGKTRSVHTEDVALRANEMAPGRFAWRKYPEHIDLQAVRFALENAKRAHCGYLIGTGNEGWMLTQSGLAFAEKNEDILKAANLSGKRIADSDKKWLRRERARLLASDAFIKMRNGRNSEVSSQEAASFFRIDEYVTGNARGRKIARIVNAFCEDPELGLAVRALAQLMNVEDTNGD